MTPLEAAKLATMIAAAYPSWKPTDSTMRLYAKMLEPFEAGLAERAVTELLYTPREFAPAIGTLAAAITILGLKDAGQYLSPEDAWLEATLQVRSVGYYRQPSFSTPALERAIEAIGWRTFCESENIEATRAHFFRIFDSMQSGQVRHAVAQITGTDVAALPSPEKKEIEQ